ncbi:L,D-transpeptidase family protein [Psychrobacter sp. AOP3-A1-26]|uniref:L,D-transpeptidase family protein n=1 Tax=Psychrobacter sp. AOP3-A1-26 TaxID=3457700 RepID=UPI004036AB27
MSFFRQNSSKYSSWLFIVIGLSFATIIGTSAIAAAKDAAKYPQPISNEDIIDKVFVDKSERRLQLMSGDKVIKSYHIALGGSPIGHKQQEGDQRTPIGSYTLDYKNEKSQYYRSMHVSYPNAVDKAKAKSRGVSPGGAIMIHGQKNGFGALAMLNQQRDWTAGCMAVTNDEMDEIMAAVKVGTPIEIVE